MKIGSESGWLERIILGAGAIVSIFAGSSKAGTLEMKHYSTQGGTKQAVNIADNEPNEPYQNPQPGAAFIAYIMDPYNNQLKVKGIDPNLTSEVDTYFGASGSIPVGTNQSIRVRFINSDMNDYAKRNLTLRQDQNEVNADPNLYDILDLTAFGTHEGYINLPNITNPEPVRNFDFRSDNYADFPMSEPDKKVDFRDFTNMGTYWNRSDCNESNHWCNFADLDRNGYVNGYDLSLFSDEWLWSGN